MKAILYALKSPEGWMGALFIAFVLVVPAGLNAYLKSTPRNTEQARAELKEVDQRDDAYRQKAIQDCIDTNGPGVAPKFDANDVVTGCKARWGKS